MNTVKVQYEIHDVVPEPEPKAKLSKSKITYRPASAPAVTNKAKVVEQKTVPVEKQRNEQHTSQYQQQDSWKQNDIHGGNNLPPLPQKVHNYPIARRDIQPKVYSDKPDWNRNLTVPDRDLLILEQDLRVDQYKARHEIFDQTNVRIPQPELTDTDLRKLKKRLTSEERRDRVEHYSFGAVANDPLPFHPYLKNQNGIHGQRWINDSRLPVDHEDWSKPNQKADKTHEAFANEYHIHKKVLPSQEIDVQHSIASVASTFTKAEKRSIKDKKVLK